MMPQPADSPPSATFDRDLPPPDLVLFYFRELLQSDDVPHGDRVLLSPLLADPRNAGEVLETFFLRLRGNIPPAPRRMPRPATGGRDALRHPKLRRAQHFKRVQHLYTSDRSYLADRILDGLRKYASGIYSSVADVENAYSRIFNGCERAEEIYISDQKPPAGAYTVPYAWKI